MQAFKKLLAVFALAFATHLMWEYAHSFLYEAYQGSAITGFVLFHAALGDAVILTVLAALFMNVPFLRQRAWLVVPVGIVIAVAIERYALAAGRWAYGPHMPLVPFLHIGLTPTLQLGLLGYLVFTLVGLTGSRPRRLLFARSGGR